MCLYTVNNKLNNDCTHWVLSSIWHYNWKRNSVFSFLLTGPKTTEAQTCKYAKGWWRACLHSLEQWSSTVTEICGTDPYGYSSDLLCPQYLCFFFFLFFFTWSTILFVSKIGYPQCLIAFQNVSLPRNINKYEHIFISYLKPWPCRQFGFYLRRGRFRRRSKEQWTGLTN